VQVLDRPVRRFGLALGTLSIMAMMLGCADTPPVPVLTTLPPGEQIILAAAPPEASWNAAFHVVDPASGTLSVWQLQAGRGLTENGASTITRSDQQRWDAARRALYYGGSLGTTPGYYRIDADGAVTPMTATPPSAGVDRWGLHPVQAPTRDGFALIGTIAKRPLGTGTIERLFVSDPQGTWTSYDEGMGFESIDFVRWSPNGQQVAFFAGTRPDGVWQYRAYRLDLVHGALQRLSEAQALSHSPPVFRPDGALVFATASADESDAAIQLAQPGATAEPVIRLDAQAGQRIGGKGLRLSPDGRWVALAGTRANPVTPGTVYLGDLATGAVRDLLATDQPVSQTGDLGPKPEIGVLAWSPDASRILVWASFDSTCKIQPVSRAIGCNQILYTLPLDGGQASRLGPMQFASIRFALWVD
jgi:hypothetical protein